VTAETPTIQSAEFVMAASDVRDLPAPVFAELAFAGKSNVGKSSLINTLVARRSLARTSSTPGRTRQLCLLRVGLGDDDRQLLEFLAEHRRPALLVATKIDKLGRSRVRPALQALRKDAGCRVLAFSAESREGRAELWTALLALAGLKSPAG
jgi:GTP-binding protein EngB required for normal cell division